MRPPRPFPKGSVKRLKLALRGARSKAEFHRVQCVWLRVALGLNANQVAQALGWRPTSVRRLQAQFLRQGKDSGSIRGGVADAAKTWESRMGIVVNPTDGGTGNLSQGKHHRSSMYLTKTEASFHV